LSISLVVFFLMLAVRAYLGRFERLFQDGTVFAGVTYTDAHVTLNGTLVVCVALLIGAAIAGIAAVWAPRPRWLLATAVPAIACYLVVAVVRWYVGGFIVAPNQLVRERPFIAHNIEMTRRAYALDRVETHAFPADTGIEALEPANNQTTLENIRPSDSGNPDLLRLSGYRHRSISGRWFGPPDDAGRPRTQCGKVTAKQPQLDQREADLYPRVRRHDESRERLHA
jgi:uncharacterized membrane protein (UPF0182 family)